MTRTWIGEEICCDIQVDDVTNEVPCVPFLPDEAELFSTQHETLVLLSCRHKWKDLLGTQGPVLPDSISARPFAICSTGFWAFLTRFFTRCRWFSNLSADMSFSEQSKSLGLWLLRMVRAVLLSACIINYEWLNEDTSVRWRHSFINSLFRSPFDIELLWCVKSPLRPIFTWISNSDMKMESNFFFTKMDIWVNKVYLSCSMVCSGYQSFWYSKMGAGSSVLVVWSGCWKCVWHIILGTQIP